MMKDELVLIEHDLQKWRVAMVQKTVLDLFDLISSVLQMPPSCILVSHTEVIRKQ